MKNLNTIYIVTAITTVWSFLTFISFKLYKKSLDIEAKTMKKINYFDKKITYLDDTTCYLESKLHCIIKNNHDKDLRINASMRKFEVIESDILKLKNDFDKIQRKNYNKNQTEE